MPVRDHQPVVIKNFGGLWSRGDFDDVPMDHFQDCENIQFIDNSFKTRHGIGIHQTVGTPLENIKRIYNYPTQTANTLIVLTVEAGVGKIYHVVSSTVTFGPILSIVGMEDFAFVPYAGRAYISPFKTYPDINGLNLEKGMQNEFLYMYLGDGTPARKAAGNPVTGTMTAANGAAGVTDPGLKVFGVVYETDTGYLSPPGALVAFTTVATNSVSFGNIPTSGDPFVTKRHIVAAKSITGFNGDLLGYQLFFIPGAVINNNVDTFLNNISFFDADLLKDASYLLDNFAEIAAGCALTIYHNRLCLAGEFANPSLIRVSEVGEPEAINQISGLCLVPPDGNPLTNIQELRDVLFAFKRARTVSFVDNGDVPSSWPMVYIDNALGCPVHGIATVLDSGASSTDFFIIATYQGITLFNGKYITPELSWKIESFWKNLDRNEFRKIQMVNAPIQKEIYCVLPDHRILIGNYALGMDPKNIRWSPFRALPSINSIAIVNIDEIIIGADIL